MPVATNRTDGPKGIRQSDGGLVMVDAGQSLTVEDGADIEPEWFDVVGEEAPKPRRGRPPKDADGGE